jgi:hypothetical protein
MRTKHYRYKSYENGCKADYSESGFRAHLFSYVCVMALLWFICFATGSYRHHLWPIYPMVGWGMGLMGHYFAMRKHGNFDDENEVILKDKDFI